MERNSVKSLSVEIKKVQWENYKAKVKKELQLYIKECIIKLVVMFSPGVLLFTAFLITKNPMLLIASGIAASSIYNIVMLYETHRARKKQTRFQKISNMLNEKVYQKEDEEFYRENVISMPLQPESEETCKYREVLEEQKRQIALEIANKQSVVNYENQVLKDEVINKLIEEIELYCIAYKIPDFSIANSEWDIYFDGMYESLSNLKSDFEYYNTMSDLTRFVFAKVLINEQEKVKIKDFINNIYILEDKGFDKKDLEKIRKDLLKKVEDNKVVYIGQYLSKRRKEK